MEAIQMKTAEILCEKLRSGKTSFSSDKIYMSTYSKCWFKYVVILLKCGNIKIKWISSLS